MSPQEGIPFSIEILDDTNANRSESWKYRVDLMWNITSPLLLFFGVVGNILTLVTLHYITRRSVSHIFFKTLAICDLISLIFGLLFHWMDKQLHVQLDNVLKSVCVVSKWLTFSAAFLTSTVLAASTIYKADTVLEHNGQNRICGSGAAYLTIEVLVSLAMLYNSYIPFVIDHNTTKCAWRKDFKEQTSPVLFWVNSIFFSLLPALIIISSLVPVIWALTTLTTRSETYWYTWRHGTSAAVVTLSVAFLVLQLPFFTIQIVMVLHPDLWREDDAFAFLTELFLVLHHTNQAVKFYIYLCTCPEFRFEAGLLLKRALGVNTVSTVRITVTPATARNSLNRSLGWTNSPLTARRTNVRDSSFLNTEQEAEDVSDYCQPAPVVVFKASPGETSVT